MVAAGQKIVPAFGRGLPASVRSSDRNLRPHQQGGDAMRGKSHLRNSILWVISLAAAVVLLVLLSAVPAWAQNPVPPTAREAAASPAFAAKLHPATRPAINKPRAAAGDSAGRPSPQDFYYDNGPINGTTDAWDINFGYIVSDTFVAGGGAVTAFDLGVWEFPGDTLSSLEWSITSAENGGTLYGSGTVSGGNLTDKFVSTNQFGYDIDKISATGLNVNLTSGSTYWVNLQNAMVPSGDPVYWDENSGTGCHSSGCPSHAEESSVGTIPSEAFDVTGSGSPPPPCYQSQGNIQIIHDFSGKGDGSQPFGVVADSAGNVYGAMKNFVYEIASKNQGWVFNILYTFTGGADGSSSSTPIVGPDGALYGAAAGGTNNLGLVYSLRPAPTPCVSSSCPWTESVVYQPTGNNDVPNPGDLVFDQASNIYGTSASGGAYGQGAVFELTPSPGGWKEAILYSFTGGSDGAGPGSLAVGADGNLYGTGGGNAYPYGMVFQLVRPPPGGSWTENVIYSFTDQQDGAGPYDLVQGGLGSLVGLSNRFAGGGGWVLFVLSPSQGRWEFSVVSSLLDGSGWSNTALATYRGDVYYANGYVVNCGGRDCAAPDESGFGWVSVLRPPRLFSDLWSDDGEYMFLPSGQLGVDASRNVYGTTEVCGKYGLGTVWKVSQ
jgi:hypothetical protein